MKSILGLLLLCVIMAVISATALLAALGYADELDNDIKDESNTEKQ